MAEQVVQIGLFSLVIGSCIAGTCAMGGVENKLRDINKSLTQQTTYLKLQEENILGGIQPEKFYEIGGERVYLLIDGRHVSDYFEKVK